MCGFAGVYARTPSEDSLRLMGLAIAHRGPDDSGIWIDPEAAMGLVHRRLSIIDLSPAGHQPMISACGRYVIAFNGEIYNHSELRQALEHPSWRARRETRHVGICDESAKGSS